MRLYSKGQNYTLYHGSMLDLEAVIKALKPMSEPADAYDEAFTDGYVTAADTIMDILKGVEK